MRPFLVAPFPLIPTGLLASAFYAYAAQAVQLSHFFAMDPASTTFTVMTVLGVYVPRMMIMSRIKKRKKQIWRSLPDAFDLLTASVEAGLGIDAAFTRVIDKVHGPFAEELSRTMREIQMGRSRREAFLEMSDRTGVEELRSLINAVVQAEAMGILGVNLLFAAFYQRQSLPTFIAALMDGLNRWRVEIDLLDFDGPAFERPEFEDRICALQLVQSGLTDAALFTRNGEICMAADYLYKRPVFVKRGSFDPITLLNLDMMEKGRAAFVADFGEAATGHVEVTEISMHNLLSASGEVTHADFLARADVLQSLGHDVLISKYPEFHRLSGYLARYTKMPIGIVLGLPLFEELFREKWYEDLAGGVLEGFGRLFRHQVRLYVYPSGNAACGGTRALGDANVDDLQKPLLEYLVRGDCVRPISGVDPKMLCMTSGEVRQMVRDGDMRWKDYVPKVVIENGRWG